ncbi:MAG: VOC family protein [Phenylobacterium sp.]|uniref:VOC family protein n=1 Tax=Phenylobacterium sp. TaxID=1871053 RepID=UPI00273435B4|nr:VOC family protein [Phenylobacterium sp.]MDP3173850.1 VOC family protein [Phenylobacterium sp.]
MSEYRLRQVALMAGDLGEVSRQLEQMFGVKVGFNDPSLVTWGLINAVFPVGSDFIEVAQPTADDAPGRRFMDKRGGDAGYMVIFQAEDAEAHRRRLEAKGVRVIELLEYDDHVAVQFHPKDFGGTLTSIDEARGAADWLSADCHWHPAGDGWKAARNGDTLGIAAVAVQHPNPEAVAARWSELLELPVIAGPNGPTIQVLDGRIDFVPARGGAGDGVVGLEIRVPNVEAALKRARDAGLPIDHGAAMIGGVAFRPVT